MRGTIVVTHVYRVETHGGEGVHCSGHAPSAGWAECEPGGRRPMPSSYHLSNLCDCPQPYTMTHPDGRVERPRGQASHTLFAFPTMAALCRYFDARDRAAMRAEGAVVVRTYECPPDTVRGDDVQVTFQLCHATRVATEEIPA